MNKTDILLHVVIDSPSYLPSIYRPEWPCILHCCFRKSPYCWHQWTSPYRHFRLCWCFAKKYLSYFWATIHTAGVCIIEWPFITVCLELLNHHCSSIPLSWQFEQQVLLQKKLVILRTALRFTLLYIIWHSATFQCGLLQTERSAGEGLMQKWLPDCWGWIAHIRSYA